MEENINVLISGAGIAGPVAAYWLRRAGFNPTVVERAPAPRPGGQTVDLRGADRTVIERMSLLGRMRALSLEQKGFAYVDKRGRITARMPADAFGGKGIVSDIELLRGDLCRAFYEASLSRTEYLFNDSITRIEQDDSGVTVEFEKAKSRRFALVVGADGLHSTVRRLAFAAESDCLQPFDLYTSWFTAALDIDLDGWFLMYNAPGGLVASARPGRGTDETKAGLSFRAPALMYERASRLAQEEVLRKRFAGAGWEVDRPLAAMSQAIDFYFDSVGQVHLERWARNRVVLLGDAGYCPSPLPGLGTSLAIVGAYILAGELSAADGDHRVAFPHYEERMRPYVSEAQKIPPGGVNGYAPMSALMVRMRALSMRWMTRWPVRLLAADLFTKADAIDLPLYQSLDLSPTASSVPAFDSA
ncbi:MAG TPA: FAD-dependent monooxygenase [Candidatus Dormibacteraeota bacterium]|nr:FAD-dependent monooxygenase [Candidatus Dormibacteraeota bacterium]